MKIWLINPSGSIPGELWRPYRTTLIAEALARRGHEVTWWTSTFSHHTKRIRGSTWGQIEVAPRFRIRLVPTPPYRSHIGLARLWFFLVFAWRLYGRCRRDAEVPDCMIAVSPSPWVEIPVVRLARRFRARLIVDIMDIWPELFGLALPPFLRWMAPVLFSPLSALRAHKLRAADAITAVCETYAARAREILGPRRGIPVMAIFNGMDVQGIRRSMAKEPRPSWIPPKEAGTVWAVHAGTLGDNYDLDTLMQAGQRLQEEVPEVRILLVGEGPFGDLLRDRIRRQSLDNVMYFGRRSHEDVCRLYGDCDVALCPYKRQSTVAMPARAYECFAAGLPLISSLRGELEGILRDHDCGINYRAGDIDSLVAAVRRIARGHQERSRMSRNASLLAETFDRDVQYRKFEILVADICGGKS